jgi:hypothetical protein
MTTRNAASADPVFAALAAWGAAEALYVKANDHLQALESRLDARDRKAARASIPVHMLTTCDSPKMFIGQEYCVGSFSEIDRHLDRHFGVPRFLSAGVHKRFLALRAVARRELRKQFAKVQSDRWAAQRACGLTKARADAEEAECAASKATKILCRTVPTTGAGLAALIAWGDKVTPVAGEFRDGRTDGLPATLQASAKRMEQPRAKR